MLPFINNKNTLILIGLSIVAALIGLLWYFINPDNTALTMIDLGVRAAGLLAMFMLIRNGSTRQTVYWRLILICIGLGFIGALLTLQHWPIGRILLAGFVSAIAFIYCIRFIKKPVKEFLDVLKLAWVCSAGILYPLTLFHLVPRGLLTISQVIFWLAMIDFLVIGFKNRTILERVRSAGAGSAGPIRPNPRADTNPCNP